MVAAVAAAPGEAVNANTGTLLGLKGLVAALAVRFGPPLWAFAAGLVLGVVESAIANVHLGGWQLGPSYREVLPLAFVLLLISLWPSREALEERE
jgi:branched-subunit amino acid ABC-type transport system permease component